MRTNQLDLEARLRDDLPRLATTLLDEQPETFGLELPTATKARRRVHPSARMLAVAAVIGAVAIGVGALVFNLRADSPDRVAPAVSATISGPVALPASPLSARSTPVMAWTGTSLIAWGGYRDGPGGIPEALLDGAEYDGVSAWKPITNNQWGHPGGTGVWAGGRLVVLAKNGGAEYDAQGTKAWRDLPFLPDDFTGGFVAVAESNGTVYGLVAAFSGSRDSVGIVRLDPATNTWQTLATTPRGANASSFNLISRAGGLDLWADGRRVARYDIGNKTVSAGDDLAVPDGFATPRVTSLAGTVAVVDTGGARGPAVFDPATAQWLTLPGGGATIGTGATAVGAGNRLLVWGGQSNPGVWAWDVSDG